MEATKRAEYGTSQRTAPEPRRCDQGKVPPNTVSPNKVGCNYVYASTTVEALSDQRNLSLIYVSNYINIVSLAIWYQNYSKQTKKELPKLVT